MEFKNSRTLLTDVYLKVTVEVFVFASEETIYISSASRAAKYAATKSHCQSQLRLPAVFASGH